VAHSRYKYSKNPTHREFRSRIRNGNRSWIRDICRSIRLVKNQSSKISWHFPCNLNSCNSSLSLSYPPPPLSLFCSWCSQVGRKVHKGVGYKQGEAKRRERGCWGGGGGVLNRAHAVWRHDNTCKFHQVTCGFFFFFFRPRLRGHSEVLTSLVGPSISLFLEALLQVLWTRARKTAQISILQRY
jgi:hypothetical protein